ncbi:hypothetical protein JHJ32_00685 [Parapedobacter sp. ISTM3]|uniref:SPW repeat-containing integral membrane domain-containing protein n=1 Tax=Parapedobacter luteus TaxID=623280 RepID=A0A1T5DAS6_9SPHI|nr:MULTISPECIES: hypothetical protein [Parapedobacter]MBK1438488.1 hypothetical protein [Parapedobacter sp. ISTM3]SKB68687.1 hypothetical protein SAMN05660226_02657 [Parapedobacter luteus]
MRFISRPVHAVLDYLSGIAMLASPWLFGFAAIPAARNIMMALGFMVIVMSLFTNYEGGVSKKIAMSTHLWGDLFTGIFLVASPWLFYFYEDTYMPHVAFGLLSIVASLLTVNSSQMKRHIPVDFVYRRS